MSSFTVSMVRVMSQTAGVISACIMKCKLILFNRRQFSFLYTSSFSWYTYKHITSLAAGGCISYVGNVCVGNIQVHQYLAPNWYKYCNYPIFFFLTTCFFVPILLPSHFHFYLATFIPTFLLLMHEKYRTGVVWGVMEKNVKSYEQELSSVNGEDSFCLTYLILWWNWSMSVG